MWIKTREGDLVNLNSITHITIEYERCICFYQGDTFIRKILYQNAEEAKSELADLLQILNA